jgi:hypothetical protein
LFGRDVFQGASVFNLVQFNKTLQRSASYPKIMLFRANKKLLIRLYKPTSDATERSYLADGFDRERSPI